MKKQPTRDPKTEPKVGDVLQKTIRKSLPPAVREVIAIHGDIVEFKNHKGKKLSSWIGKWHEWATWAEVIKTAPCLILAALLLTGCDRWNSEIQDELIGMRVVQRDGCEYFANKTGHRTYVFTHKGDCKNHKSPAATATVPTTYEPIKPAKSLDPYKSDLLVFFSKAWDLGNTHAKAVASGNAEAAEITSKEFFLRTLNEVYEDQKKK